MGNLQDTPHTELARPVTKRVDTILHTRRIPEQLSWAFTAACTGRPGPVLVDIPIDVQLERVDERMASPVVGRRSTTVAYPDSRVVGEVSKLLAESVRPVVLAGSGVYWSHAEEALGQLAVAADLPVFVNGMARGLLAESHRSALSMTRAEALRRADLVLALGIDFDFRLGYGRPPVLGPDTVVVQVDEEPGRLGGNRHLTHGVVSDIGAWLRALLDHESAFGVAAPRAWIDELRALESTRRAEQLAFLANGSVPIHPMRFAAEVARFCRKRLSSATAATLSRWPVELSERRVPARGSIRARSVA